MSNISYDATNVVELEAEIAKTKILIQQIFKRKDFAAMPTAQQNLKRLQLELTLVRRKLADEP